ncbi:DNA-directed RNA polymerase subunit alpha [Candidatus Peribacteria bacterium RIFCSPLOWO2_12_FULL_55_15]|nr:MAG: DNA-directed RNA polymerase subunit alpha [Candidatus Peribacteria bacterium RIFCSPHIGHO2_01_FULL_54_22]OGJ63007.1 MAG: DNA-directed RNA polymerase subunit alpha [Candidatus Peribacteria bacterium RIFCSPHIGHO2_02_FULL_55_24]OGJ64807.1 MAG: DNA-directed RNA polymerase subunit alpha [Candidatus Peribacteria bacterium RIFCSPHIGHO2_12_FULL_54_10]OGJ67106.1 MAG: DNA-directed RNA polymerase subunit alpha [Candidatus Peribacteria bacterium RIFCSPLOWO2_01_FULL_54_110]OGJ68832.1 MAG: DNA-directe
MHIIQEEIGLPIFSSESDVKGDDAHRVFTIAPLPPGYGMTLGNALRRALLSSLPGAAITAVRMDGVQHEYMTIKGMKESVLDLTLNFKQVKLRKHSKDPETLTLSVKGPKTVTAKDISVSADVEILNPTLTLCTLDKGAEIEMKLTVEKGVGYIAAAERNKKQNQPGLIHIDAVFSPVERVRYDVEASRVGQRTDLDKLVMEIVTNGSLTAEEALRFASQLLQSYFQYFGSEKKVEPEFMADFTRTREEHVTEPATTSVKESYTPIEILNLSPRTLNALINAGVGSIEQLTKCTEATLTNFRGFGTKALAEVRDTFATRGSKLADEVEG